MKKSLSVVDAVFKEIIEGRRTKTLPAKRASFCRGLKEIEFYNTAMSDRLTAKVTKVWLGDVPKKDLPVWRKLYGSDAPTTNVYRINFSTPTYSNKGKATLKSKYAKMAQGHGLI